MEKLNNYLVPEYYSRFLCKGPECRTVCCRGWGISISMKEYFSMLSLECSDGLRRKLDCAFHVLPDATEERYAQITPNWLGSCPMHLENGLCGLQCECGEENIPAVCRLYPRGIHDAFQQECSMSNSCEAVVEMLFAMKEPMRFEWRQLQPAQAGPSAPPDDMRVGHYPAVRALIIETLQDRRRSLPGRLHRIGMMLARLHRAFLSRENQEVTRAVQACRSLPEHEEAVRDDLAFVRVMYRMCRAFSETSASIEEYAQQAMARLGLNGDAEDADIKEAALRYRKAAERFETVYPDWERMFEQLLVNHVFFEQFPFSDAHESLEEEYISLCAVYAFVRFLAVCWTENREGLDCLSDVCAAAFRLIDHSSFDWNAAVLLEKMGMRKREDMDRMVLS